MLKKRNRLKTEKDFLQTLRLGKKTELENISVYIYHKQNLSENNSFDFKKMYDESGNFLENLNVQQTTQKNLKHRKINYSKLGVIVSTKNGKAHDRNKFKRRIRNIMRNYLSSLDSEYIIIKAKGKLENLTFSKLYTQIQSVFTTIYPR